MAAKHEGVAQEVKETKEIALVREQTSGLVAGAKALNIRTEDDAHYASGQLTFIAEAKKKLEGQRVFLVKPLNDHVKDINGVFKEWTAPLLEADAVIRRKMLEFHVEEQKRIEAEIEEARPEMGDVVPDLPAKVVHTATGSTGVRKTWAYEVVDEKKIPRAYLMLDEGLVNLNIRDGIRKIAGLRIYQKESLAVR